MPSDATRVQSTAGGSSGSEWKLAVLHDLLDGEKRFNELRASTCASSLALSRAVDDLVDADLVARRVDTDAPATTHYRLTGKGRALGDAFGERDAPVE